MTRDEGASRNLYPVNIPIPSLSGFSSRLSCHESVHCAVLDKDARKKIRVYAYRPVHFGKITVCRLKMAANEKEAKGADLKRFFERESRRRERQV